jgi:uncharacterized protein (DUF983 family)
MEKCEICGEELLKQPTITKDDKCDACHKKVVLAEEKNKSNNNRKLP